MFSGDKGGISAMQFVIDTDEESREISRRLQAFDDVVVLTTSRSERSDQRRDLKLVAVGRQGFMNNPGLSKPGFYRE